MNAPYIIFERDAGESYAFCRDCDAHSGYGLPVGDVEYWGISHQCRPKCDYCGLRVDAVNERGICSECARIERDEREAVSA